MRSTVTVETTQKQEPEVDVNEVWKEFKSSGNEEQRDFLITNYLHLVKYVVGRMASGLPAHVKIEDLYSTGVTGLIKAVDRYDPTMKNKFETYAILLIKGAIIDEMRSLDWVPRSVHQKASMIEKGQEKLRQKSGRDPTDGELAKELNVTLEQLDELYLRVRPAVLIPLNADAGKQDDEDYTPLSERIPDKKAKTSFQNADYNEFRKLLEEAVLELPEQERTVLVLYYYENLMLKEIGQVMSVSESRVSQIHTKAVTKLRGRLQNFMTEFATIL